MSKNGNKSTTYSELEVFKGAKEGVKNPSVNNYKQVVYPTIKEVISAIDKKVEQSVNNRNNCYNIDK